MNSITKLFNLKNKTVILTGSAGRLGSRFAHVLTDAGADVVLVDTDEQKNRKLEKQVTALKNEVILFERFIVQNSLPIERLTCMNIHKK